MRFIADLHIHSSHSQATGNDLNLANLEKYALIKGIDLLGTGDFTHPKWIEEIKEGLTDEDGTGIYRSKNGYPFMLQTEISLVYTQGGKGRRVHNLVLAPNLDAVRQITDYLLTKGRIDYDGRPIFKISCIDFVDNLKRISKDIEVIPAHAWTPWFGVLGEKGGFNSLSEAFGDQVKHIHAIETGLSSNPPMNWRVKELDRYQLLSFSDLHSYWPWRMGREATIFNTEVTYKNILEAIRTGEGLSGTIEVDPGYGKYHFTGHRACGVCINPKDAVRVNNICPKCGKKMTVGVVSRVEELADPSRPEGYAPRNPKKYHTLIPLSEILAKMVGTAVSSKKVAAEFENIISTFGTEMNVLLNASEEKLLLVTSKKITDAILKARRGEVEVQPGFDGEYGIPLFSPNDRKEYYSKIDERIAAMNAAKKKTTQASLSGF
ncbi:MAG TPA: endonuclease Q family protein [Candidatus Nanoarchaeia archaeon]|nr:endonuclease Q family protein [Candidatus Nanoarchaeia archaeon]